MRLFPIVFLLSLILPAAAQAGRAEQCKLLADAMSASAATYGSLLKSIKIDVSRYTAMTPDEDEMWQKASTTADAVYNAMKAHIAQLQDSAYVFQKCARQ